MFSTALVLLNFAHPLTQPQLEAIAAMAGQEVGRVEEIRTQFDPEQPFGEQASALVNGIGLTSDDWQGLPLLVNLPSLSIIAALVLAELHGRMGHFPAVLRLRPVSHATAPEFEVAEILNLQEVRQAARLAR